MTDCIGLEDMTIDKPRSKIFHFEEKISENNCSQSWAATNLASGRVSFVKIPARNPASSDTTISGILNNSYLCQQRIRTSRVLAAKSRHTEAGALRIEYPWLDGKRWRMLSEELFWQRYPSVLTDICLVADYLHFLGLAHCDLKFSNFLVDAESVDVRIILADLDFLTTVGSSPKATILGTPEHIAPEIMANDRITGQSDNYSVGISLNQYLRWLIERPSAGDRPPIAVEPVEALIETLTNVDSSNRPRILIDALPRHQIITDAAFAAAQKTLLTMTAVTCFLNERERVAAPHFDLNRFLIEQCRVFGLPNELVADFEKVYRTHRQTAFQHFRSFIDRVKIDRYLDCWQLRPDDDLLAASFSALAQSDPDRGIAFNANDFHRTPSDQLAKLANRLKHEGHPLKSYLCLKEALRQAENPDGQKDMLPELGALAIMLNRPDEAVKHLGQTLVHLEADPTGYCRTLYDLIIASLFTARSAETMPLIEKGLSFSEGLADRRWFIEFRRLHAWVLGAQARHGEAESILETLLLETADSGMTDVRIKVQNDLGMLAFRQGKFMLAKDRWMDTIALAKQHDLLTEAVSSLGNLASLLFDIGEYGKAVIYGKLAVNSVGKPYDMLKLPTLYSHLTTNLARLGQHQKAQEWLQQYLTAGVTQHTGLFFGLYYSYQGWLAMYRGQLTEAEEWLHKGIALLQSEDLTRNLGSDYLAIAEIALQQGAPDKCRVYLEKAADVFTRLQMPAHLIEVDFVRRLNAMYNVDLPDPAGIPDALGALIDHNCRYFAVWCLFHILLDLDDATARTALQKAAPLLPVIMASEAPLFKATAILADLRKTTEWNDAAACEKLKEVYTTLDQTGYTFLALLVCGKIADLYELRSKTRLAARFRDQAIKLAEALSNHRLADALRLRITAAPGDQSLQTSRIDAILGISEILKDLTHYEAALEKIIEYAVGETGAERGVLLLRARDSVELQVKSFVNCDEISIVDIRDFSRNIPHMVAADAGALIIDNALQDKRTRDLKSVIMHNIRSVMCIPIKRGQELHGVLYLDHHTIPALFDEADITFVSSLANFISVALMTAEQYRAADLTSARLSLDLAALGAGQTFITQDATLQAMLTRLPEIARTNASILIQGESGTGKEILCGIIHDLSLRREMPLVKLNCAAIPATLIESELFGIARGVATGVTERPGKFSAADGGTLFLDEIGDMPMEIQAKILRVLEYQEFEKVGSNRTISTDIRFVYATNKNLPELVASGEFREDLYYRINTITIEIPPLRERRDDIPLMLEYFVDLFAPHREAAPRFSVDALEKLAAYPWPGNVRELRNLVERACILHPGQLLKITDLPVEFLRRETGSKAGKNAAEAVEKARIRQALVEHGGNQAKAARSMRLPLTTFRRRIKKYNISSKPIR